MAIRVNTAQGSFLVPDDSTSDYIRNYSQYFQQAQKVYSLFDRATPVGKTDQYIEGMSGMADIVGFNQAEVDPTRANVAATRRGLDVLAGFALGPVPGIVMAGIAAYDSFQSQDIETGLASGTLAGNLQAAADLTEVAEPSALDALGTLGTAALGVAKVNPGAVIGAGLERAEQGLAAQDKARAEQQAATAEVANIQAAQDVGFQGFGISTAFDATPQSRAQQAIAQSAAQEAEKEEGEESQFGLAEMLGIGQFGIGGIFGDSGSRGGETEATASEEAQAAAVEGATGAGVEGPEPGGPGGENESGGIGGR